MAAETRATPLPMEAFRGVAGQLAAGVSVVVSLAAGEPLATTASSVVAASWEPPLLAVFFRAGSRMALALEQSGRFTVNVLAEADHALARRCARPGRAQGWEALAGVPLARRDPEPPLLLRAVAWVDCAVAQAIPMGDHLCVVGEVLAADRDAAATPLVYYRGRFRVLGEVVAPAPWLADGEVDLAAAW
jgi:3-hydroxy-9,10-secoandrosta-1,3,5(10)-triene-9,17-dione monooxygenase reductase component